MEEERVVAVCILDEPLHSVEHLLSCRPQSIAVAVVDKEQDIARLEPIVTFR